LKIIGEFSKNIFKLNLFEQNQGCFLGVTYAISWAFEFEEELIILEDDIEINENFLRFMNTMLTEFKYDLSIGSISGANLVPVNKIKFPSEPIRLSCYTATWGWGTWRNRWLDYIEDLDYFPKLSTQFPKKYWNWLRFYTWKTLFHKVAQGKIDSYGYRWLYSNWRRKRLTINSNLNLTKNVGFDFRATHTKQNTYNRSIPIDFSMSLDYKNVVKPLERDQGADEWASSNLFHLTVFDQVLSIIINVKSSLRWTRSRG
jgi:sulfur relay (sulfurtransferase) DsrC/TusE family protein